MEMLKVLFTGKMKYVTLSVIAGIFILATILDGFYTVNEHEYAILTMFGKPIETNTAGLYFKIPFIQHVKIVDSTTKAFTIGYIEDKHGKAITVEDEGVMITSDFNFVNVDFYLEYKISDPFLYLYSSIQPELILKNIAIACIRNTIINFKVDDVITTEKGVIQAQIKEKIIDMLNKYNVGLSLVNITMQDAVPPTNQVNAAFKEVETARQNADTTINVAMKYQSEQIPLADAQVDKILQEANAIKSARIAEAQGQVARFEKMYIEYKNNPEITKQRLLCEMFENIMPNIKVYIVDDTTQKLLPIDKF